MRKKLFDCLDFCEWNLGKHYNFKKYYAPQGTVYVPSVHELIEIEQK